VVTGHRVDACLKRCLGTAPPSHEREVQDMQTANASEVPFMSEVRRRGLGRLIADVIQRFQNADGASHTRALGYQGTFAMMSGFIGLVGLASVLGIDALRATMVEMSKGIAPGPSGQLLQAAARESSGGTAAVVGLGASLISGTLAMAQIERSANRMSGRTQDRPAVRRFLVAFVLALSAGTLAAAGLLIVAGGQAIATGFAWKGTVSDVWMVVRWIVGAVAAWAGLYLLFRFAPDRPLGGRRPRTAGVLVSLLLWVVFTVALAVWFSVSSSSQTYGPLVSVIALLLWAGATSFALHLGMALTAELAGQPRATAAASGGTAGQGDATIRVPDVAPDRT
jgi:YihY family inner membrane protein